MEILIDTQLFRFCWRLFGEAERAEGAWANREILSDSHYVILHDCLLQQLATTVEMSNGFLNSKHFSWYN